MRTKWTQRAACLVMVLTAILGMALQASAGDAVPMKGRAAVVITGPGPEGIGLAASGVGEATHLGRFTRTENVIIHDDGTIDGKIHFTAANGDRLCVEFVGAFTSPTTAEGTYTFTGGSGRFSDASGEADFTAETADGLHFSVEFEGTISF
jgi:hypothetical protein